MKSSGTKTWEGSLAETVGMRPNTGKEFYIIIIFFIHILHTCDRP